MQNNTYSRQLTAYEHTALTMLSQGLNQTEIAHQQNVKPTTIQSRCQNIYFKLGVNNASAAVAQGFRQGLLNSIQICFVTAAIHSMVPNNAIEVIRPPP